MLGGASSAVHLAVRACVCVCARAASRGGGGLGSWGWPLPFGRAAQTHPRLSPAFDATEVVGPGTSPAFGVTAMDDGRRCTALHFPCAARVHTHMQPPPPPIIAPPPSSKGGLWPQLVWRGLVGLRCAPLPGSVGGPRARACDSWPRSLRLAALGGRCSALLGWLH